MSLSNGRKTLKAEHGQRRSALVRSLLTEVFQGKLRAGERLIAQEVAVRFGVSQTPIREALIELAGVGIIDLLPNRGAVVRRVTTKDVRDILQVRRALECEAVRSACGRIDPIELEDIAAELRDLMNCSPSELSDFMQRSRAVDSRLHDLIAESCGNFYLANELNRLKMLFRAFRDVTYSRRKANVGCARLAEEACEHLAIVEGLQQEDAKAASKAMARHMRSGVKYWSRIMPAAEEEARRARKTV
ncbi:MAG: GntR family transcriptional regulator [Gemmataceae bacterium]